MANGSDQQEINRLLQKEWRENIIPAIGTEPWIRVYQSSSLGQQEQIAIYCGLVPHGRLKEVNGCHEWDIYPGDSKPSFTTAYGPDSKPAKPVYDRFGRHESEVDPLILLRDFNGLKPSKIEIAEEFRLFHNLYFNSRDSTYVRFDESGDEITIIRSSESFVDIRRKEIRQFLAAKEMSLAIYFENIYHSHLEFEKLNVTEGNSTIRAGNANFEFFIGKRDGTSDFQSFSAVLGKKMIPGLPLDKCGIWPFDETEEKEYEEFIIGIDENDQDIMCSPQGISHTASKEILDSAGNVRVASYMTQVFFRRLVLDKYRSEPSKYRVDDGHISCGDLWSLRIDNNHSDYVIVLLGDLGRLSVNEQAYWNSHNKSPDGGLSRTAQGRWIDAEWTDAEDSALRFKQAYEGLSRFWKQRFGWHLFQELATQDAHHFNTLRRPLTQEHSEFDEIILSLSMLLVDSINAKKLRELIPNFQAEDNRGKTKLTITVLEEFLMAEEFEDTAIFIGRLRTVQELRSTGAAHRKGTKHAKVSKEVGLDTKTTQHVADDIFTTLTEFLDSLRAHFCPDETE